MDQFTTVRMEDWVKGMHRKRRCLINNFFFGFCDSSADISHFTDWTWKKYKNSFSKCDLQTRFVHVEMPSFLRRWRNSSFFFEKMFATRTCGVPKRLYKKSIEIDVCKNQQQQQSYFACCKNDIIIEHQFLPFDRMKNE